VEIGSLDVGASQQTTLTVKASSSAVSTNSYITVKVSYYAGTTSQENTATVSIPIKRIPIIQISDVTTIPSTIEPGNKVKINFQLKNEGDGPAKDVKVILTQTAQKFVVEGTPETFIDDIESKGSSPVGFNLVVDPSVAIGTYSIPITLSYSDETKTVNYTDTKYLGITISGKYNFVITSSQSLVAPGKDGTSDLEIANGGSQKAFYLTLKVLPSDPIIQIIPSTIYIGNLDSDDYGTEELKFKVADNAFKGTYPLNLQLVYKDSYGQLHNETASVDIKVSSIEDFSAKNGGVSPIVIVIIIIVLAAIGFFLYKKLKKKK
jgi:hypothetical protein